MKRKKALAVFKDINDAEQFTIKRIIIDTLKGHKTICRIVIAPDLIECANKKRNLRLQKAFAEMKKRYVAKHWPKPSWLDFQKYETTIGRNFIRTSGLEIKSIPKPIRKEKTKLYLAWEKLLKTLSYRQKQELKLIINNGA